MLQAFPSTCSVSPIWCTCLLNLWSAPACNSQSPSSLAFLHFQHLCCVRHVEAPAGECMICSSPQSFASSFSLPCCRQRIHYEGLARSVHACGDHCPFCTQDLVPVLSDPLLAASFEQTFPSISTRPLQILHSILSVSLMACHILLPFFPSVVPTVVDLLISNPWMTAEWNGLPFTLLPKAPRLLGFFNAVRPLLHAGHPCSCHSLVSSVFLFCCYRL